MPLFCDYDLEIDHMTLKLESDIEAGYSKDVPPH